MLLLATGLFEGLTGYLLPFDQTAYWATVVGDQHQRHGAVRRARTSRRSCEAVPRSARTRSAASTRSTCCSSPARCIGLIGLHLYLVVRLGVSSPPWSKEAAGGEPEDEPPPARAGLVQPGPRAAGVRRRPTE